MFAVKGWSVDSSSLKPQTELFAASGQAQIPSGSKKSKKRKRDARDSVQGPAADGSDVGSLWDQHIEGKQAPEARGEKTLQDGKKQAQALHKEKGKKSRDGERESEQREKKREQKDSSQSKKSKKDRQAPGVAEPEVADGTRNDTQVAQVQLPASQQSTKLTPMQSAMRQKLISARFRHLNETLYTAPSAKALFLFDQNPEMFEDYHAGFRQQVSVWPENPLDNFVATIRRRGKVRQGSHGRDRRPKFNSSAEESGEALPRTHGTCIVADLGCGDARLAETLKTAGDTTTLNLKLNSFDLHSPSKFVTKADISNLPLADGSVDVAIFCLALMGTNWISFIEEAYRILHWKGELWVSEIKSRFGRVGRGGKPVDHSVGNKRKLAAMKKAKERKEQERQEISEQEALQTEVDGVVSAREETDVSAFVDVLRRRGFLLKDGDRSVDLTNRMFVKMEFIKAAKPTKGKGKPEVTEDPPASKAKPKLKFLNEGENEPTSDDEAKVLKPCLYKIR